MQNYDLGSVIEEESLPDLIEIPKAKLIAEVDYNKSIVSRVKLCSLISEEKNRTTFENITNVLNKAPNIKIKPQTDPLQLSQEKNNNNIIKSFDTIPFKTEVIVNQDFSLDINNKNASVELENKTEIKKFCDTTKALKENQLLAVKTKAVFHQSGDAALSQIKPVKQPKNSNTAKRRRNISLVAQKPTGVKDAEKPSILTAFQNNSSQQKNPVNNTGKRPRIMSVYERRYQTDDGRGVVSNGYLSTSRNSSAASSAVHSDDNNDISNQYYIASSSTTASASALPNGSTSNHAPTMATLCNIGNTCYLNSVVYTLRFAPQFVHNLHHLIVDLSNVQQNIVKHRAKSSSLGRNMNSTQIENARSWSSKDLASLENYSGSTGSGNSSSVGNSAQVESQKSSQQLLTEKLHELYQNLNRNEVAESSEPFHADTLLHAIQEVSSIFEGNQQQDAHEFLMCVLNSIRETCQTLIKAIAECPDIILNGCLSNSDQGDLQTLCANEKDVRSSSSQSYSGGIISGGGGGGNGSSSLSTSNISKVTFFTRKSKRKEEAKNSKNQRLQSPLKDSAQTTGSNSLFYLNTVDLSSGTNGKPNELSNSTFNSSNQSATSASTLLGNSLKMQTTEAKVVGGDDSDSLITNIKDKEYLAEKIRQLGLDFFRDDFEGITVSTTKCLSCETITEQKESMIDIAVPVPISGFDNTDYMDKSGSFIQNSCITREYFRGENKYRCEQCTGYTEAIRSISYEVLPRLLVIQLSRFSGGMEKINSYIPTSFTLQCFCSKCCELSDSNKLHIYKLYSVITHVGATMSVGHYIAYTCSLDWANEYVNCPKDMRRNQQYSNSSGLQSNASVGNVSGNVGSSVSPGISSNQSSTSLAASAIASSGTSLMKKMKFVRSKAQSSGDMSKNVKNLNGVTSSSNIITNGIGKLSMNTTCHSTRCCATRLKSAEAMNASNSLNGSTTGGGAVGFYGSNTSDLNDENLQNGASQHSSSNSYNYASNYGSTGRGGYKSSLSSNPSGNNEPIWYMCDDDKVKAMTQRELEDLLSPSRKITITPYLLFYARIDLQSSSAASKQPTPPKQTQAQSWSSSEGQQQRVIQTEKM